MEFTKPATLPWHAVRVYNEGREIVGAQGDHVAVADTGELADLIVRAVNCHDELLAALRELVAACEREDLVIRRGGPSLGELPDRCRAAIARATVEQP